MKTSAAILLSLIAGGATAANTVSPRHYPIYEGNRGFEETANFSESSRLEEPKPDKNGCSEGQQIAVPSYIHPKDNPTAWKQLIAYDRTKVSILVANVVNGPNVSINHDWSTTIHNASMAGKKVLGYVRTGYLGQNANNFTTLDGARDMESWVQQIQKDVDTWYFQYGESIGGIFFDEGLPECGRDNEYADLYARINNYTKRKYPTAFTALNPGLAVPRCYESTMDTLMTYENSYDTYINKYVPNNWTATDPYKIWHVVYGVPEHEVKRVTDLACERGAGLVQVTDGIQPNPYNTLPKDGYMRKLMDSVAGGDPLIGSPPSSLRVRAENKKTKCLRSPSTGGASAASFSAFAAILAAVIAL
ncbi:hypothetical protein VHEMI01975 [[Torrubiella] hemipterigena]|uniref:Spherulation-specific family 4 n=1 Tax=[Torrubiella] hemipterigena TaxID=1531966 RepID=A0A0A1SNB2_9HYPO|nr:hypothetical protein VHEMI01975 [[Torrubiella] hemipterigena]